VSEQRTGREAKGRPPIPDTRKDIGENLLEVFSLGRVLLLAFTFGFTPGNCRVENADLGLANRERDEEREIERERRERERERERDGASECVTRKLCTEKRRGPREGR
jgi:hypothetical protein